MKLTGACLSLLVAVFGSAAAAGEQRLAVGGHQPPTIATFSIVARDPLTGDYGVAVQSRYFAVGAVVPHAAADTGAVATQARGNLLYGSEGLALMDQGVAAGDVIEQLIASDPLAAERQVGVVDRNGVAATFTGDKCLAWAGGRTGAHYAVQGNLLAGPQVVDAIATAYELAPGDFANRLLYALEAGQAAGGDARGRQSAALLVVRKDGGYLGLNDRYIELHVEDHVTPIHELGRLLRIRQAQLASEQAKAVLERALGETDAQQRATLLDEARQHLLYALDRHPSDDYGWWSLARVHLLKGDPQSGARAAQRALLENPAWRRLSAANREALGVSAELLDALLQVESFERLWSSLGMQTTDSAR